MRPKFLRGATSGFADRSHDFRMGDWKPEQTVRVPWGKLLAHSYLWTVPPRKHRYPRYSIFLTLNSRVCPEELLQLRLLGHQPVPDFLRPLQCSPYQNRKLTS